MTPNTQYASEVFAPLEDQLSSEQSLIEICKQRLNAIAEYQNKRFEHNEAIDDIIRERARLIDELVTFLWDLQQWTSPCALLAVGGYGRGELHPHSDIDLLLLFEDNAAEQSQSAIESFLTSLWDCGLQVGHSVRSVAECVANAAEDITIATNLMECRILRGDEALHDELMRATSPLQIWPSSDFFLAKWQETVDRHKKYANTEYNLEPNLKSSPGGLRDIQTISWIAKRHFGAGTLEEMVVQGFLMPKEKQDLLDSLHFLWRVRYALHMISGREEDRLLFDHQRRLAKMFGFEDDDARLAVEGFMKLYYRCAMNVGEHRDLLMQHFDETIRRACEAETVQTLNPRFIVRNNNIEVANAMVFERTPSALMEIFTLIAMHPYIEGVRASTIRLIRSAAQFIDDDFRENERNRQYFMDLLRSPRRVAMSLRLMHRYGVLGRYLPEFGSITGQMQHDLFHIYAVDAHTMELVKNLRRFHYRDFHQQFPVATRIMKRFDKPELLYVAGLYHDIAKGRGGDHSQLGAVDARAFCEKHGISRRDTNLICWLVENHLLMSGVAQRQDISDPEVIAAFAQQMGDERHLDSLYALTVADINATNPSLWNSWRASLMRQLYAETRRALRRGLENPIDKQEAIEESERLAIRQLEDYGFLEEEIRELWSELGEDYFLREQVEDIVWHSRAIAEHDSEQPLILIKRASREDSEGATQIFVHTQHKQWLFAVLVSALEQLDLNIQDARIYNSGNGYTLDTFFVLGADGEPLGNDEERLENIRASLIEHIAKPDSYKDLIKRRTPRQMRLFSMPTQTSMATDLNKESTVLEVVTPDRPGLLARIAGIFYEYGIELENAKITTLGERVEDVFFITDPDGNPIEDPQLCEDIQNTIRRALDEQVAETAMTH